MALCLAAGCLLLPFTGAEALDTTFEVGAGYDSNAAEVSDGEGSGMARYLARFRQPVTEESAGASLDLYLEAVYCQYFDLDDNRQLRAGTQLTTGRWNDRFQTGLFAEVVAYRDDLVTEDEYNSVLVGGSLQWLADARLTLSLQPTFSRVDYLNPVSLPGQRGFAVGKGKGKGPGGQDMVVEDVWVTLSQKDAIWYTELTATYAMGPKLQTSLSFLYRNASSSNDYESYQELGAYAGVFWYPSAFIEVFASGYRSQLDYDLAPDNIERRDDAYGASLGAAWWMESLKLFVQFDQTVNDSPIIGEDYKKSVALCGVSYTF